MFLSLVLLALVGIFLLVLLVQRGGVLESWYILDGRGARIALAAAVVGAVSGVANRALVYLNSERETWIVSGHSSVDSVARGFDTKSRFRSLAQPLGRITDRDGRPLAGYELRDGHLRRAYPAGAITSHIVGYWTGPVRDGVGVEKALTMVNDSLRDDRPHDVQLSIDLRLQREAFRALGNRAGAVVVLDAASGEVLAAADYPTYNPDSIWSNTAWAHIALDEQQRSLTSRAIKDNFSPGSSIKPLIALAAHRSGTLLPEQRGFVCNGEFDPGSGIKPITDHGAAHGRLDIARAMRVSCNMYFSQLAYELVGFDATADYLDSLGFNDRLTWNTGIFLNEYSTLLPARSWVNGHDAIARSRIGIGQASVKVNPIHEAVLMAGIANGGIFLRPSLETNRPQDTLAFRLDSASAAWIEALLREPLLPGGTAVGAFSGFDKRGIIVYGKTGTADREPDGREPSWFVSYARANGRCFAVVVAIQNRRGMLAGSLNAPIARRMYEVLESLGYFRRPEARRQP